MNRNTISTLRDARLLSVLVANPDQPLREVHEAAAKLGEHLTAGNVSNILVRLADRKLVTWKTAERDRPMGRVSITIYRSTRAGRQALAKWAKQARRVIRTLELDTLPAA